MVKMIPNILTLLRLIGGAALIFFEPLNTAFFAVYTAAGLTDALDGFAARKLNASSELGKKLDSAADLLFYAVMLFKLSPTLWELLPTPIWIAVGITVILRIASYATAAIKYKKFASLHTPLNKLTGVSVFILPYFVKTQFIVPLSAVICVIALAAAVHELSVHLGAPHKKSATR